jgi:Glycosyl hydrolases family 32 N-terminal domain
MYREPASYIADFCIVRRHGLYHLFHIHGERGGGWLGAGDFGHAISRDLFSWTPCPNVVPAGPSGAWDEFQVWAPHIVERDGEYCMFYTGVDGRINQKIGLATSADLFQWEKASGNPVLGPGPWSDRARGERVACRDPMVFADAANRRYLMYYTATTEDGRPCIGLAESQNLEQWSDRGPTYIEEDRSYNRLESAYLCEREGRYYLFYSGKGGPNTMGSDPKSFAHFEINYLTSDDPTGRWVKPKNHVLLEQWCCASEHPVFDGTTYMFFLVYEMIDGRWRGSTLSDPKRIAWLDDGTIEIHECARDDVYRRSVFREDCSAWIRSDDSSNRKGDHVGFRDRHEDDSAWRVVGGRIDAHSCDDGYFMSPESVGRSFAYEAEILAERDSVASLVIRSNRHASSAYLVSLDYGRGKIGMYKRSHGEPNQLIQERSVGLVRGQTHKVRAVVEGEFFEIYLDGGLSIVRADATYGEGYLGLHSRGLGVHFSGVRAEEFASARPR